MGIMEHVIIQFMKTYPSAGKVISTMVRGRFVLKIKFISSIQVNSLKEVIFCDESNHQYEDL